MITVKVPGSHPKTSFYLTTVYPDMDTTVSEVLQAYVTSSGATLPKKDFIPPSMSREEYSKAVQQMMDESKTVAKIVALQRAGYDVQATGEGARVEKLMPGNTAEGILKEGDIITAADGQRVQTATDLVNLVRNRKPGTPVSLNVKREAEEFQAQLPTRESDSEPGIAVVGILIQTHNFGHNLPVDIEIDAENIGGSSAGLMFTLSIIDAIQEKGLAPGYKVAGTGTISLNGKAGPIGGVGQKVIGAEQAGMDYFLCPKENYEAAKSAAKKLQVVSVGTVDDAISFLKSLQPKS